MNYDLADIGKRIESALEKQGASRADLGNALGVGAGAIGRYIRGEADPGSVGIAKIADFCKVSIPWLITGDIISKPTGAGKSAAALEFIKGKLYPQDDISISKFIESSKNIELCPLPTGSISDELPRLPIGEDEYDEIAQIVDALQNQLTLYHQELTSIHTSNIGGHLNMTLIKEVIEAVMEHLQNNELTMPPDKVAELVEVLYEEISESGAEQVNKGTVARLIRLAS